MQILGLYGKLVSGPWMRQFHANEGNIQHASISPLNQICLATVQKWKLPPTSILETTVDCFGHSLDASDALLRTCQQQPPAGTLSFFSRVSAKSLESSCDVLAREMEAYVSRHLSSPSSSTIRRLQGAPLINNYAERTLGMVDAQLKRARNASMASSNAKLRHNKMKI